MNNVLVCGCNGQLGSEIRFLSKKDIENRYFFTDTNKLNITNHSKVESFICENKITHIINCAAYTAVDKAESEPIIADKINHLAVANLANLAKIYSIVFIHISTDYVFDGESKKPYSELNKVNPKSIYGYSKRKGEESILKINPANTIIIRTSWLYSRFGDNFVKSMLNISKKNSSISVVSDQFGSPTNAADLAQIILNILIKINNKDVEIFHFSNEGLCSWYEFSKKIFELQNIQIHVNPIRSSDYPTKAMRPKYSVMSSKKIKNWYNLNIKRWDQSLKIFLRDFSL